MAVTVTTLQDGSKYRVIHAFVDTADATDVVVYDYSADTNNPNGSASSGRILKGWVFGHGGADGEVEFDGTTDFPVIHLPASTAACIDYSSIGGVPNKATSPTGDVTITTTGVNATDHLQIIFVLYKH